ncbi:MAG: hypothetical protein ACREF3_18150 [Acetobacteraceae bacterium]
MLLVGAVGVAIGSELPVGPAASMILPGVFLSSVGCWIVPSAVTCRLRERLSASLLRGVYRVAAAGMAGFAALSPARGFGD